MDATLKDTLVLLHILAAMAWGGGLVAVSVLGLRVRRSGSSTAVGDFVRNLRLIGPVLFAPAAVVVLGTGCRLVIGGDDSSFGEAWILIALALFAAAFVVGAALLSRYAIEAERAADAGDAHEAGRQLGRWGWGMTLIALLLVVATWDMVFRPGG